MRTNIALDDELVERAKRLSGAKNKREVIHAALRTSSGNAWNSRSSNLFFRRILIAILVDLFTFL
jgi:Arc/MetJ family transcription regulator